MSLSKRPLAAELMSQRHRSDSNGRSRSSWGGLARGWYTRRTCRSRRHCRRNRGIQHAIWQVLPSRLCTAWLHMEISSGHLAHLSGEAAPPLEARELMGLTQVCEEFLSGRGLLGTFGTLGSHHAKLGKATCADTVLNERYAAPGEALEHVRKPGGRARCLHARDDKWGVRAWAQQNARATQRHPALLAKLTKAVSGAGKAAEVGQFCLQTSLLEAGHTT
mmetsp:Transcript_47990/g.102512  ORF Transcript_47990/g.102512 Transcript_47990/m.102512 type:complete len:220 (-) Transcript_47990:255-914(-)